MKTLGYFMRSSAGLRRGFLECFEIHGQRVFVRVGTPDMVVAAASLGGEFEVLEFAFPHDTAGLIIDAGGYIGTAALALRRMFPEATIVSVEPSSSNLELLKKNIEAFPNMHYEHAALVPEGGPGQIELRDRGTGAWGLTVVEQPADRGSQVIERVPTVTIEQICRKYGVDHPIIVKVDIEGAELPLLARPEWLSKVPVLLIELHDRIAPGCEQAFFNASKGRFVFRDSGEKFVSVGPGGMGQAL